MSTSSRDISLFHFFPINPGSKGERLPVNILTAGSGGGGGGVGDFVFGTTSSGSFSSSFSEELDSLSDPLSVQSEPLEELSSELSDILVGFGATFGDLE